MNHHNQRTEPMHALIFWYIYMYIYMYIYVYRYTYTYIYIYNIYIQNHKKSYKEYINSGR